MSYLKLFYHKLFLKMYPKLFLVIPPFDYYRLFHPKLLFGYSKLFHLIYYNLFLIIFNYFTLCYFKLFYPISFGTSILNYSTLGYFKLLNKSMAK